MDERLDSRPEGPLKDIRVIDITTQISGPLCSQSLGDLGADVIKVEPLHGETTRWMTPPEKAGISGFFSQSNRNKRSLALDLKSPEGIEIIRKLAADADVLVENFRGGVADRLGIGFEDLKKINDRLIYAAITGYGSTGPYSAQPAYDMLMQGMVGMMPVQGDAFKEKPQLIQSTIVDKTTAMIGSGVIVAALYARDAANGTAKGQRVDIPMMDTYASCSLQDMLCVDSFIPSDLPDPKAVEVLRTYETTDGYVVGICLMDHHFEAFCTALGCEALLGQPGCRNIGERITDFAPWLDAISDEIAKWSSEEFLAKMAQAGVPFGPVNTIREFVEDPQVKHNRTVFDAVHPEAGTMRFVGYPGHFSDTPASLHRFPPRLGEHNKEILKEIGYDEVAINELCANGVLAK